MLRMFVGKPGSGKSSGALKDIIQELINGERLVVTNLSILPGELCAFLAKRYPQHDVDIHRRLLILTNEQAKRFWLYRTPDGVPIPDVTKEQEKRGIFPDFGLYAGKGVLVVIDEAHVMFDSRAWAESGQSLTFVNSQHRKLNDEMIFITQFVDLIDKRVRGFAQEFWYFRNGAMEKMLTFFKAPAFFTVKVYHRPVTEGGKDHASETHRYSLDLEMCACYDTSAGVGISGRKKPEKKSKKGFAIWWILVPSVLGIYFLSHFPQWIFLGGQKVTKGSVKTGESAPSVASSVLPSALGGSKPRPPAGAEGLSGQSLYVTGISMTRGRVNVSLSDGSTHAEDDGTLGHIYRRSVVMRDGRHLFFRTLPDPRSQNLASLSGGLGVKVTPDKPDDAQRLGDGSPAEVSANVSTGSRSRAERSSVAARDSAQIESPPRKSNSVPSSWEVSSDGVARLRPSPSSIP